MRRHAATLWRAAEVRTSLDLDPLALAFLAALVIGGLYDIYRYPLRINARVTSPTYADTPLALSVGKYAAIALVTLVAALRRRTALRRRLFASNRQRALVALTGWVFAIGLYHGLRAGEVAPFRAIAPVLCVLPLAGLLAAVPGPDGGARLGRLCLQLAAGLLLLHACFNAAEIMLWLTTGRLPALGYAGSLVRFGGVWDDPNSCAAYSALFLVYLAARPQRFSRRAARLLIGGAALNLVVAWSFSAVIILAVGVFGVQLQRVRRKRTVAAAAVIAAGLAFAALPLLTRVSPRLPVVGPMVEQKLSGSLESRASALAHGAYFADLPSDARGWLIGRDAAEPNEAALVWWVSAIGLIGAALAALWIALSIRVIWRTPQRDWALPVAGAFLLGSLFVPYLVIFPLGAFLFLGLAALAAFAPPGSPQQEPPRACAVGIDAGGAAAASLPPTRAGLRRSGVKR